MRFLFALVLAGIAVESAPAQSDWYNALQWRGIGPTRSGRGRAAVGVPSQPNVFYVGFDNGGVWRSTDYGSTWKPLFDRESTGSIGAIAVAPSNPEVIYVGTGAGIIRPDLATGNGMYKSTDAGKTWKLVNETWGIRTRAWYYIKVFADPHLASEAGLSVQQVGLIVETALAGRTVGSYSDGARDYDVIVVAPQERVTSPEDLASLPVVTPRGARSSR